ncbi:MAG: hypothetical protein ACLRM9_05735 [Collinsella aerofaciens]
MLLDRDVVDGGVDLVTSNNRELVAGLVDALAAAGSERLCLLTEASDDSPVRRERAEAFTDELSRRGLAGEVVTLADGGATGVGRLTRPSAAMQAKSSASLPSTAWFSCV